MNKDFNYYKKWAVDYLNNELQELTAAKNIEKSTLALPIGSISIWNGIPHKKIAAGKWVRILSEKLMKKKTMIKNAIREIEKTSTFEELDTVCQKYRELFRRKDGSFPKEYIEIQIASGKKSMQLINEYKIQNLTKGGYGMKDEKLEYFKNKIIAYLDKLDKENDADELQKSIIFETLAKSRNFEIGTVREWKGKKYRKVDNKKWVCIYDKDSTSAKRSIGQIKKLASKCETSTELLQLVLKYRERFSDANGYPIPLVQELSEYVSKRNDELESKANAAEQKKEDSTTQAWEKIPGLNGKPMFVNKPSLAELKEQLYFAEKANRKGVISGNEEFVKKQIKYLRQAIKESGEIDESAAKKKKEKEEKINSLATNRANQLELASKQGRKQALEDVIKRNGEKSAAGKAAKMLLDSDFVAEKEEKKTVTPEDKKLSNGKTIKEMREKYGIKVNDEKKGNKSAEKDGLERVTELIESLNKDLPNQEITLSDKDFIEKNWGENKNYVIRTFKKDENTARQEATIAKEKGQKDVAEYQEGKSRYYNYIASNLNHILVENQINGRMGTVYKQIERDPMLAVEFLLQKHSGYIENVFSYKINGIEKDVGFGDSNFGLKKQIEKHIIEQTDFETVEEMMKKIDNVLKFGKENNKNQKEDRIRVEYNNYAVILSVDEDYGNVFISSFKKIYPNEQFRSKEEKIKKMEEISNRHPNFFNQEGSLVPDSISENITQSNSNVNKNETKKSMPVIMIRKSVYDYCMNQLRG